MISLPQAPLAVADLVIILRTCRGVRGIGALITPSRRGTGLQAIARRSTLQVRQASPNHDDLASQKQRLRGYKCIVLTSPESILLTSTGEPFWNQRNHGAFGDAETL